MHTRARAGVVVLGLASITAGVLDLIWGEFESNHQPIEAWGDHIPGVTILAYVTAVCLIIGGAAMLWERSRGAGALVLAFIYGAFSFFWLPRFVTAPTFLGYHPFVYCDVLSGTMTQVIVVAAAVLVYKPSSLPVVRWIMGVGAVAFGLAHLTNPHSNASTVPTWLPFGGDFWVVLTGIAFVLAGVAILTGVLDVLASRLLALMLFVFSAIALVPIIVASPHDHVAWGGNAYNLAAVGSVWIFADALQEWRRGRDESRREDGGVVRVG
jgi:uncharacterized membrane protein